MVCKVVVLPKQWQTINTMYKFGQGKSCNM